MITIKQTPTPIGLMGNPVVLALEPELTGTAGTTAFYHIEFPTTDITVTGPVLKFNGFTFSVGATVSHDTFRPGATVAVSDFVQIFNDTPSLNYKYRARIEPSNAKLVAIEALKTGSRYNITVEHLQNFQTYTGKRNGTNTFKTDHLEGFGMWLELYLGKTGNYGRSDGSKADLPHIPVALLKNRVSQERYEFDLSGLVSRYALFPRPSLTPGLKAVDTIRSAYVKAGYVFINAGGYRQRETVTESPLFRLLPGAQGLEKSFSEVGQRILAGNMKRKPSTRRSIELMSFLMPAGPVPVSPDPELTCHLYYTAYLSNGTTSTGSHGSISMGTGSVVDCRVDFEALDLAGIESSTGEDVLWYEVLSRRSDGVDLTEAVSFALYEPEYKPVSFVWLGPLGRWESFTFSGKRIFKTSRKEQSYQNTMPLMPDMVDGEELTQSVDIAQVVDYASHGLQQNSFNYVKGILASTEIYRIQDSGLERVRIQDFAFESDDETRIYTLEFSCLPTLPHNSISR
jgi:hypothetical protein